jgi:2-phospho-L-lactate guanylyltransferase
MTSNRSICAVVPVKEAADAKRRLDGSLSPEQRRQLAHTMFEDVLVAVLNTSEIASILVVTADVSAAQLAARHGAELSDEAAREGHTRAIAAAARRLDQRGLHMLTLPADIPLVQPLDIRQLLHAHWTAMQAVDRGFSIVPARDERGSNAIVCSPAHAVPLRFGEDSFLPHLRQAKAQGIDPMIVKLPNIALDIDTPDDLALLAAAPARTRSQALLAEWKPSLLTGPCTGARRKAPRSWE